MTKTKPNIKEEKMKKKLSNCCKAKLITNYGEEGTNCYFCDKCLKPADIYIEKKEQEDKGRRKMKKKYWIDWLQGTWGYWDKKLGTQVVGDIKSATLGEKLIETEKKKKWWEFWKV